MGLKIKLSAVVPAYNEEATLIKFIPRLKTEIEKIIKNRCYEIIVVDDGSTDKTLDIIQQQAKKDNTIKIVSLSRNFGKEIAISAGIFYASGEAIVTIDADGQHPPEILSKFYQLWNAGNQLVIGVREQNKNEGFIKHYGSKLFYLIINKMTSDIIPNATDYCLIDASVRTEFIKFSEHKRMARQLISWMGYKPSFIPFQADSRTDGQASYGFSKLFYLALNSLISSSMTPLYSIIYIGLILLAVLLIGAIFIIINQFFFIGSGPLHVSNSLILSFVVLISLAISLTAQGIMALYISHIYTEAQNRPLFIVNQKQSMNLKIANTLKK